MGFVVFAILALVVLPIIMLLQKGLGIMSKDKQIKEEMKLGNKNLSNAWVIFAGIVIIAILCAFLSSCNNQPGRISPTYTTQSKNLSTDNSQLVEFSSAEEMEIFLNKLRANRNSVDDKDLQQISNKEKHYRANYKQLGTNYNIRFYSNLYKDNKDDDWITKGLIKRHYNVLHDSYGNCKIDSIGINDFMLISTKIDKGLADKYICHIKNGCIIEEILDFKDADMFESVLQIAIKDSGSNYLGEQDKVINVPKEYTVLINENGPLGKQLKWLYTQQ